MDSSTQIRLLFREGKLAEAQGFLKEAKDKYLDAASLALQHAQKVVNSKDQQGYKSIAITLIDYSKKIQHKLDFQNIVFSSDVDSLFTKTQNSASDDAVVNIESSSDDTIADSVPDETRADSATIEAPTEILPIHKLIVIQSSGTPIFSLDFNSLVNTPAKDIDEFLFAGALTAITSLMTEVIQQSVRTIDLAQGCLLTNNYQNLVYVVYAGEDSEQLVSILGQFATQFSERFANEIQDANTYGISLNDNKEVIKLVHNHFGY